ncbi:MAG: hypothetical protein J6V57_00355, partial [Spirochaetaceae bacterium]|nr:hypothetical protein [Spirochaetaceae bacterium]
MGFKKTVFVVLMGIVVFIIPGIILAHLTPQIGAVKIMAFCIVFSMFFHPLQLLVVDWACSFEGFSRFSK